MNLIKVAVQVIHKHLM